MPMPKAYTYTSSAKTFSDNMLQAYSYGKISSVRKEGD